MSIQQISKSTQKKQKAPTRIIIEKDLECFYNIIEPYKTSEYLPINIIDQMIKYVFVSCVILHDYTHTHKIIKLKVDDLLNAPIMNWQYNRPADLVRCNDIARYVYKSKMPIDTMLYLSFNNIRQTFDVIDGIHRYTALKILQENNSKQLDLLTPSEFGSARDAKWLYESYIIVNLRINSTEGELIELFKTLNKSNPIPDLYVRDVNKDKREIIETIANNWQVKYKSHFSANSKPNKPNVNRDRFIDLLCTLYDKYKISEETKLSLEQLLDRTNADIPFNIPKKISKGIKEKCDDTGCWLFIYSIEELCNMI